MAREWWLLVGVAIFSLPGWLAWWSTRRELRLVRAKLAAVASRNFDLEVKYAEAKGRDALHGKSDEEKTDYINSLLRRD